MLGKGGGGEMGVFWGLRGMFWVGGGRLGGQGRGVLEMSWVECACSIGKRGAS